MNATVHLKAGPPPPPAEEGLLGAHNTDIILHLPPTFPSRPRDECRRVLPRDKIRSLHKLSEGEIDRILVELVANAIWHETGSAESAAAPDPGDDHLWRLLNSFDAGLLVTGDQLLLDNPPDTASALSPRSFVD